MYGCLSFLLTEFFNKNAQRVEGNTEQLICIHWNIVFKLIPIMTMGIVENSWKNLMCSWYSTQRSTLIQCLGRDYFCYVIQTQFVGNAIMKWLIFQVGNWSWLTNHNPIDEAVSNESFVGNRVSFLFSCPCYLPLYGDFLSIISIFLLTWSKYFWYYPCKVIYSKHSPSLLLYWHEKSIFLLQRWFSPNCLHVFCWYNY